MTFDIDKLESLAKAAQRGEVSWSFGPSQTLELIAEVRRLRAELNDFISGYGDLNQEVVRLRENSLMSGMDLLGVIVDVEQGHGFDDVCLNTIKRVSKMLGNASRGAE